MPQESDLEVIGHGVVWLLIPSYALLSCHSESWGSVCFSRNNPGNGEHNSLHVKMTLLSLIIDGVCICALYPAQQWWMPKEETGWFLYLKVLQLLLFCSPAVPEQLVGSSRGEALRGFPFEALLSIPESNPRSPRSLAAAIGNATFPGPPRGSLLSFPDPAVLQTRWRADNPIQLWDSPHHPLTRNQNR